MIRIFIESGVQDANKSGKEITNEQEFVIKFIEHHFPAQKYKKDFDVIGIGGYTKIELSKPKFEDIETGDVNLVIFDADETSNEGGFAVRRKYLLDKREQLGVDFDLFLWPNNQDDGDFESLLEQMINHQHQGVLDCYSGFEKCVGGRDNNGELYALPGRKAEMYTYIDVMKLSKKDREKLHKGYYLFENKCYWNLDAEASKHLKDFLSLYFVQSKRNRDDKED